MNPLEPHEVLSRAPTTGEGKRQGSNGNGHTAAGTSDPVQHHETHFHRVLIMRAIWRARYRILMGALIGAALGGWFFRTHPVPYISRAIALFNGEPPPTKDAPVMLGEVAPGPASLRLLATSSEVLDRIITQHDLYTHYGIDTNAAFFHEAAVSRLRHNVEVLVLEDGSISIAASDIDRTKAVALANAVFNELSATVRQRSEAYYERQVALHSGLIADQEEQVTAHLADFEALAARLGPVLHEHASDGGAQALELQKDLAEATAKLSQDYGTLRSVGRNMEMLAAMHRDGLLGTLTLVERPMVDLATQPRATMIWGIVACFLVCLVFGALLVGIWASESRVVHAWMADMRKAGQA